MHNNDERNYENFHVKEEEERKTHGEVYGVCLSNRCIHFLCRLGNTTVNLSKGLFSLLFHQDKVLTLKILVAQTRNFKLYFPRYVHYVEITCGKQFS